MGSINEPSILLFGSNKFSLDSKSIPQSELMEKLDLKLCKCKLRREYSRVKALEIISQTEWHWEINII